MDDLVFEWDARKAAVNLRDHGVSFDEALTVFADALAAIHDDPDHSDEESRELIVGKSDAGHRQLYRAREVGQSHQRSTGHSTRTPRL